MKKSGTFGPKKDLQKQMSLLLLGWTIAIPYDQDVPITLWETSS